MKNKNADVLGDKRKQQAQVLMMIAGYCRRQRMLDIDLRTLSPDAMDSIANEVVDLFVSCVDQRRPMPSITGRAEAKKGVPRTRGHFEGR
jgi:hypothetical protein